jgi:flagellar M-ring protein FliF
MFLLSSTTGAEAPARRRRVVPQIASLWSSLDQRRRIVVIAATVAVFLAVLGLSRLASRPDMALLYTGLDSRQAGEVIAALDQHGAPYEVRGASIFVDGSLRDELRMTLAAEGLPANTGAGYELLDGLSGFGTTSQMFDAAYWRAKEGELARTIMASPMIRQARVHISNPSSTPFQRDVKATASIALTPAGAEPTRDQAAAFRHLVASAVAGMRPEDVTVIDASTGRVIGGDDPGLDAQGSERAAVLKANAERLLAARVGPGNAVVEVSVDIRTEQESISERRFDPDSRVAISTDVEEVSNSSQNGDDAPVTVASNLPSGDAADSGRESQSRNSETRERTNFEVSETVREVVRAPGEIRRLTVAVLVSDLTGEDGASVPRSEAEMAALRELVASAVGLDEARGDVLTLKSLPFDSGPIAESAGPAAGLADRLDLDAMQLIQIGVLSLVALALGLFVVRPILTGRNEEEVAQFALTPPAEEEYEMRDVTRPEAALSTGELPALLARQVAEDVGPANPEAPPSLESDPVGHLKQLIADRQPDTIEILKSWLEDDSPAETA